MPQVELATTIDQLDALRPEWEALERRTPEATGFQSFAWCRQWLASAAGPGRGRVRPRVLSVRCGDRLVMLWPLQLARSAGVRVVRWVGEPMTQYGDALAEPGPERAAWRAAAEAALRDWRDVDLVLLRHLRADGVLAGVGPGRTVVAADGAAPFLDLADPGAAAVLAARQRGLRRRQRRLAGYGAIVLRTDGDAGERAQAVRTALALKREWLRRRRLFSCGLSNPVSAPFLERLAYDGHLAVSILEVDDAVAAVELGIRQGTGYRSLLSSYDLRLAAGAPGHVLTTRLVAGAGERGIRVFDFLAPRDEAKLAWASGCTALCGSALVLTWRGCVGLAAVRLRPQLKRLAALLRRAAPRPPRLDARPAAPAGGPRSRFRALAAVSGLTGSGDPR